MRLGDLAEAVAPHCETVTLGLRPGGEKRHETLINGDEMRRALAIPAGGYVITPSLHSWQSDDLWNVWDEIHGAIPCPPDMVYRSDLVGWKLSVADMRKLLEAIP